MLLRGMIFDVDGTLVDTNPTHVEAWRRAFKRLGVPGGSHQPLSQATTQERQ